VDGCTRAPFCLPRCHHLTLTCVFGAPRAGLEALFAITGCRMLSLFSLHLSALFRFVAPHNAAGRGTGQSMMRGVMTGDASYDSTLNTALRVGRRNCRQSENNR
jgi:hypothetical protein